MVSEGDSGSRSWSRVLPGILGPSGTPCLIRATSGTPSSGLRDVPDWVCLLQSSPSPALAWHSGLSRPGVLEEALGRRKGLSYRLHRFLFLLWSPPSLTPIFQFSRTNPEPPKSPPPPIIPALAPPSHVQTLLSPPPPSPDQSMEATSPLTSLPAQAVFSRARFSPPPSPVPTAHPSRLQLPRSMPSLTLPPPPIPRPFPIFPVSFLSTICLFCGAFTPLVLKL